MSEVFSWLLKWESRQERESREIRWQNCCRHSLWHWYLPSHNDVFIWNFLPVPEQPKTPIPKSGSKMQDNRAKPIIWTCEQNNNRRYDYFEDENDSILHCLPPFCQRHINRNIANAKFSHIPNDNESIRIYIHSSKKSFSLGSTMYFIST